MPAERRRVVFSLKASLDLHAAAEYSLVAWGEEQAADYVEGLELACQALTMHSRLGRRVELAGVEFGLEIRRIRFEKHMLYYTVAKDEVRVLRILHERMLPKKHL